MPSETTSRDSPAPGRTTGVQARQLAPVTAGYVATTVWLGLLGLLTTPYLLHRLGPSTYAVFALITLVTAYLSNLELGFGHGTIRFLARARAQGDAEAEKHVIGTSLLVFSCAAVAGGLIVLLSAPAIVKSYANFPPSVQDDAVVAVRLGAVVVASTFLTNFFVAALQVHGRFSLLIGTRLALGTLSSVLSVGVAAIVADVRLIVLSQVVVALIFCAVVCAGLARSTSAPLRPSFHRRTFRIMGGFSLFILATGLATQAMIQGPPTVLAGQASAAELAAFAVPALVLQQLGMLVGAASIGFLPFASGEAARADTSHLSAVYTSHMRLTLLAMGPLAAFFAVFADPLLSAWVGSDFGQQAVGPLQLLAGVAVAIALSAPPADVARGFGKPSWTLLFAVAAAVIGIVTAVLTVGELGAAGAALGLLVGLGLTTPVLIVTVTKFLLGQRPGQLARSLFAPTVMVVLATLAWWCGSLLVSGLLGVLVVGVPVALLYVVGVWRRVLSERELEALTGGIIGGLRGLRELRRNRRLSRVRA